MLDNLIIVAVFALLAAPLATTLYKAFMKCFKNDTDNNEMMDSKEYEENLPITKLEQDAYILTALLLTKR